MNESRAFVTRDDFLVPLEAEGSRAIWMGAGSAFAVILVAIGMIILFATCSRRSLGSVTDLPESDCDIDIGVEISSQAIDPFLSEENALSVGAMISGQHLWNDGDESLYASRLHG
jgi:hypothetical protein